VFRGNRYDTGDKLNFIKATIKLGVDREDIGEDLREFLHNFAKTL
jgi:UTP--glucose-1-phosphate uridylyltransferase